MFPQSHRLYTFQGKLTQKWLALVCLGSYCLGETSNKNPATDTLKNKGYLIASLVPYINFNIHRELVAQIALYNGTNGSLDY